MVSLTINRGNRIAQCQDEQDLWRLRPHAKQRPAQTKRAAPKGAALESLKFYDLEVEAELNCQTVVQFVATDNCVDVVRTFAAFDAVSV